MANFLYFVPDKTHPSPELRERVGLGHVIPALESPDEAIVMTGHSPSGATGVLFRRAAHGQPFLKYDPEAQHWAEVPDGGYWLGYWREQPPTPDELAREELIGSYVLSLGDGKWRVPAARCFPEGTDLPEALLLGPGGNVVREPLPRFAAVCRLADDVWQMVKYEMGIEEPPEDWQMMTAEGCWPIACEILSINYRMGEPEVSALRLLNTQNVQAILQAFVDFPTFMEMRITAGKKDESPPDSGDTTDGGPGS